MRSSIFFFSYVALVATSALATDVCSKKSCPNSRQSTSICFSDSKVYSGVVSKVDVHASCGYFTKVVVTKTTTDIAKAFDQLISDCKTIKELRFAGHGNDGYQLAGELDQGTVQNLSKYACVFDKKAEIDFMGCLVGKGCSGDMLLFQTAKSLLSVNGGSVAAPTALSVGFPGIIPHFSLNGKYRKINYDPKKSPGDTWTQSGIAISDGGTINERCSIELNNLFEELDSAKVTASKKGCGSDYNYVSSSRIENYKKIQRRLSIPPPYLQSANSNAWYDLASGIDSMKYQIRRFEQCGPSSSGAKKTGIWESTRSVK